MLADGESKRILTFTVTGEWVGDTRMLNNAVLGSYAGVTTGQGAHPGIGKFRTRMPVLAGPTDKPPPGNALTNGVSPSPNNDDKRAFNLELLADGAYASRDNMKLYRDNRIRTTIPL